jgi:hypothetical protein
LTHHSKRQQTRHYASFDDALIGRRYAEAEKTNGRWAMMAVAGILGQELLGVTPEWWNAGAKDYGVPMAPLTAMEFLVSTADQHTWHLNGQPAAVDHERHQLLI